MAENKSKAPEETTKAPEDNRVEVFVPKGNANDDPNMFVSINCKNYLLPRGKKSLVPPEVAAEIERSIRAQEKADANIDALLEASK